MSIVLSMRKFAAALVFAVVTASVAAEPWPPLWTFDTHG
jgi:hypothetical protein